MKRFLQALAALMVCGALIAPSIEAQSRGGGRAGGRPSNSAQHQSPARPSDNHGGKRPGGGNHGNGNASRPGNDRPKGDAVKPGNNGGNHNRPNHPGNGNVNRPGNNGNHGGNHGNSGVRPGGNRPGDHPGHNQSHNPGPKPGNNFGHGPSHGPGHGPSHRPQPGVRPGPGMPPPMHRPKPHRPWSRPVPPPRWVPGPRVPTFASVLGLTFGIGVNASLNLLLNNNYVINAYDNNAVYLNNVNMLNLRWPDATLYYANGGLSYGDFIYSTSYYDTARYNMTYSALVNSYGSPVSRSNPDGGMQTCWYGRDGRFVTLTYAPMYGADGIYRYYTTLSFGM